MAKGIKKSPLWQAQQKIYDGGICQKCGKHEKTLSVDHIFPASLLVMWGLKDYTYLDAENLQFLCRACNVLKAARFDFHNPKTIPLIEKYMKILKETYSLDFSSLHQ